MSTPIHSTGRGGAGNIGEDSTNYTDAGIVHEGNTENPGSSGRGGAGNISSPLLKPAKGSPLPGGTPLQQATRPGEDDVVPETDLKQEVSNYHTGRGGAGNEHRKLFGGHSTKAEQDAADGRVATGAKDGGSVIEKVKHALHLDGSSK